MKPLVTMLQFGIDLGGTKTEIIALKATGETLLRRRTPTPSHGYQAIDENIVSLVTPTANELKQPYPLGIGIPGAVRPVTERNNTAKTVCLSGEAPAGRIAKEP